MWIGWSVIWTDLKFEPVLSAFWDWPKYVCQTWPASMFEFRPELDL